MHAENENKTLFARFFKNTTFGTEGTRISLWYYRIPKNPESDYAEVHLAAGRQAPREIIPMGICPDDLVSKNKIGLAFGWGDIGSNTASTNLNKVFSKDKIRFFTNTVYNGTVRSWIPVKVTVVDPFS